MMADQNEKNSSGNEKTKTLPKYLGFASLGALVLLILAVLPAEYGVDPTGFGRLTGLTELAPHHDDHDDHDHDHGTGGHESEVPAAGVFEGAYKTETIQIDIENLGEVEHKLFMPEGGAIVYSWEVEGETPNGGVYFDFHGHPASEDAAQYEPDFFEAYGEGELPAQSGSFQAPFPGYHGWYFLNLEDRPVTIVLTVSGFYDSHLELYRAVEGNVIKSIEP